MQIERRHEYDFESNRNKQPDSQKCVAVVYRLGNDNDPAFPAQRPNAVEEDKEEEFLDEDPYSEGEEPEMRPTSLENRRSRKTLVTSVQHPRKHEKSKAPPRLNLKNINASKHIVDGVKRDLERAKEDGYVEKDKKKVEVFFMGAGKVEHWDSALHEEQMLESGC